MRPAAYSSARTNGTRVEPEPVLGAPVAGQPERDQRAAEPSLMSSRNARLRVAKSQLCAEVTHDHRPAPLVGPGGERVQVGELRRGGSGDEQRRAVDAVVAQPPHRRDGRGEDLVRGGGDAQPGQPVDDGLCADGRWCWSGSGRESPRAPASPRAAAAPGTGSSPT